MTVYPLPSTLQFDIGCYTWMVHQMGVLSYIHVISCSVGRWYRYLVGKIRIGLDIPNPDWVGYTKSGLGWIYQIRIGLDKTKSGFSFFHLDPYPAYHNPKLITLKRIQNTLFINKGHAKNGFSQENSSSGEENSSSGEKNSSSGEEKNFRNWTEGFTSWFCIVKVGAGSLRTQPFCKVADPQIGKINLWWNLFCNL